MDISDIRRPWTLVIILLLVLSLFVVRKMALYILFIIITAVIVYFTKLYHLPVDISPLFFLEIVITRFYGFGWTLLFVFVAYVIPKVIAGSGMKWESYAFLAVSLVASLITIPMKGVPLIFVGYIASIIQYAGGIFIGTVSKPFFVAALDGIANVTNNILWFLIFSGIINYLL